MKLSTLFVDHFKEKTLPNLPISVTGNGYGTSNVPAGAVGTLLSLTGDSYVIEWKESAIKETFSIFGGMAMSLDVVQ